MLPLAFKNDEMQRKGNGKEMAYGHHPLSVILLGSKGKKNLGGRGCG